MAGGYVRRTTCGSLSNTTKLERMMKILVAENRAYYNYRDVSVWLPDVRWKTVDNIYLSSVVSGLHSIVLVGRCSWMLGCHGDEMNVVPLHLWIFGIFWIWRAPQKMDEGARAAPRRRFTYNSTTSTN